MFNDSTVQALKRLASVHIVLPPEQLDRLREAGWQTTRPNRVWLKFDSGLITSIIWGAGTYSSNYHADFTRPEKPLSSYTFEVMFFSGGKITRESFTDNDPLGYIDAVDIIREIYQRLGL